MRLRDPLGQECHPRPPIYIYMLIHFEQKTSVNLKEVRSGLLSLYRIRLGLDRDILFTPVAYKDIVQVKLDFVKLFSKILDRT